MAINLTRAWTSHSLVPQAAAMADPGRYGNDNIRLTAGGPNPYTGPANPVAPTIGSVAGSTVAQPAAAPGVGIFGGGVPNGVPPGTHPGQSLGGPGIAKPVFGGGPAGAAPAVGGNSAVNNILAQILGPNYQSLLNTANNGYGGAPASLQDVAALITAQSNASQNYARRNLMENAIMQQGAAQWNAQAGQHLSVANPSGGGLSSPFNPDWVTNQNMQRLYNTAAQQSNQTAAAAASFAPGVQNSIGQQNTGARWNPNTMSGWISPAQNNFRPGVQSGSPAFNIMSAGI